MCIAAWRANVTRPPHARARANARTHAQTRTQTRAEYTHTQITQRTPTQHTTYAHLHPYTHALALARTAARACAGRRTRWTASAYAAALPFCFAKSSAVLLHAASAGAVPLGSHALAR